LNLTAQYFFHRYNGSIIVRRSLKCRTLGLQVLKVEPVQRSLEPERGLVEIVVRYRGTGIQAHVKGLGSCEGGRNGALPVPLAPADCANAEGTAMKKDKMKRQDAICSAVFISLPLLFD
jgi:hypothetical protein